MESLKNVYDTLESIKSVGSTLQKEEILHEALQDTTFLKVIQYMYDPRRKYKTKKLPAFQSMYVLKDSVGVDGIFKQLDSMALQKGASKQDKDFLSQLASIDEETWEIVQRVCVGDARAGINTRTINKVRKGTIKFTPYCRCSTKKKIQNIIYPAIWNEKANGAYAEMRITTKNISRKIRFGTRDSHKIHKLKHLKNELRQISENNNVYCGELRVWNTDGSIMDRQTGNGIINQCIQGTVNKQLARRVFFSMWDCIPLDDYFAGKCTIPYDDRFERVKNLVTYVHDDTLFRAVKYQIVANLEEAQELTNAEILKGNEGGVLKNLKAPWKDGTSTENIKMKARFEGELRAIKWEHGDKGKRHEHRMGRIIFETDDGLVRTAVGSGFSDKMREEDMDKHMGRIAELEYESLSESKLRKSGTPKYKLYGPATFSCWRDDKDTTDTLEDLKNR